MTAQQSDKIIYKGIECDLHTNPMEYYFTQYPDKRPHKDIYCTGLWRGYVAVFEIEDSQIYLKDIKVMTGDFNTDYINLTKGWKSVINEVFPNQEHIKLDWFSGTLVLPSGELVNYVHMGYASTYEHYILLDIENGDLKSEKQIGHEEYNAFREQQFQEAFKKSDEYENMKTDLQIDDDFMETVMRRLGIE